MSSPFSWRTHKVSIVRIVRIVLVFSDGLAAYDLYTSMSETVINIPIELIDEPRYLLQPVLRHSKEYLELRTSIEKDGLITAVLVRPIGERYRLVGGNYRRTICVELKRATMPCVVREMTDLDEIALQLKENAIRCQTKPAHFANQLKRMMELSPGMTFADLAGLTSKSPLWIRRLLNIASLDPELQKLIDRGGMSVENAVLLARIPPDLRDAQIDNACCMTVKEFRPLAQSIIKQHVERINQGKLDAHFLTDFKPNGYCRSPKEVQNEVNDPQVGPMLIIAENCKTLLDAFQLGCRWSIHLDRDSVELRRQQAAREGRLESAGDSDLDK